MLPWANSVTKTSGQATCSASTTRIMEMPPSGLFGESLRSATNAKTAQSVDLTCLQAALCHLNGSPLTRRVD